MRGGIGMCGAVSRRRRRAAAAAAGAVEVAFTAPVNEVAVWGSSPRGAGRRPPAGAECARGARVHLAPAWGRARRRTGSARAGIRPGAGAAAAAAPASGEAARLALGPAALLLGLAPQLGVGGRAARALAGVELGLLPLLYAHRIAGAGSVAALAVGLALLGGGIGWCLADDGSVAPAWSLTMQLLALTLSLDELALSAWGRA